MTWAGHVRPGIRCSFDAAILGAVLGRWLGKARQQDGSAPEDVFDPMAAHRSTSARTLGFGTPRVVVLAAELDGFGIVGYQGASGKDADDWIESIQAYIQKQRPYARDHLASPHDARNKTFSAKHSPLERFIEAFGAEHVRIVPQTKIEHRTNAGAGDWSLLLR
jgi:phage terminase large subunit